MESHCSLQRIKRKFLGNHSSFSIFLLFFSKSMLKKFLFVLCLFDLFSVVDKCDSVAGQAPDCVMHSATKGRCVYESRSGNELYTAVLSFEGEDKITITDSEKYGKGSKPSITVFTDFQGVQRYVEAHEVSGGKLHAIYGTKVDGGRLSDGESYQFDTGVGNFTFVSCVEFLSHFCLFVYLFVCLFVLFVCSVCLFICLFCLFVCSVCWFVLFVCLFVYVCLFA